MIWQLPHLNDVYASTTNLYIYHHSIPPNLHLFPFYYHTTTHFPFVVNIPLIPLRVISI